MPEEKIDKNKHHGEHIKNREESGEARHGSESEALNYLEDDILAKNESARRSIGLVSPRGAFAMQLNQTISVDDNHALSASGGNILAKNGVGETVRIQSPDPSNGENQREHRKLDGLENDFIAKNNATAKHVGVESHPEAYRHQQSAGGCELNALEDDILVKNSAARICGMGSRSSAHDGRQYIDPNEDLNALESDIMAKRRAANPVGLEAQPGAYEGNRQYNNSHFSDSGELNALEGDILAKNTAAIASGGESYPGAYSEAARMPSTNLTRLEGDILAKNQARNDQGRQSGAQQLCVLQDDVIAKSRNRPLPLTANDVCGPSFVSGSHAVSGSEQSLLRGGTTWPDSLPEESPLFTIRRNNQDPNSEENSGVKTSDGVHLMLGGDDQPKSFDINYQTSNTGGEDFRKRLDGVERKTDLSDSSIDQAREDKDADYEGERVPHLGDVEYATMQGELVTATPIEAEEEDSYIPAAVEFDPDAKPPLYKNRRCRIYVIISVVFVVAVVIVSVVVTQVSSNSSNSSQGVAPTMAPTTYRDTLGIGQEIEALIGANIFQKPDSVHSKALDWIINKDPMQLEPGADHLLQRYIMVFFYFATSQKRPWISCGEPQDGDSEQCYHKLLIDILADKYQYQEILWIRWLSGEHECKWAGVVCKSDQVTEIDLAGYHLSGVFPGELAKLEYLRNLRLPSNEFTGRLPSELADLKHLTDIELQFNQFTGTIPMPWFYLTNFIQVSLSNNGLNGSIPSELGLLTGLQRLFLQENLFTGTLPLEMFDLINLEWAMMHNNEITGSIPTQVGLLTKAQYFYLYGNLISGTLPTEIGVLTELVEFGFHDTDVTGTVPEAMYALEKLQYLEATNCQMTGTISTSICNTSSSLQYLLLSNNKFSGTIPSEISRCTDLIHMEIDGNDFKGTIPSQICSLRAPSSTKGLQELRADCSQTSAGVRPIACPTGCCTVCCNQETDVCLDM